jgi:hypothetical protein
VVAFAVSLSFATMVRAQSSSTVRDPFARIIDRSDAIVLGRVLDAGFRWTPTPDVNGRGGTPEAYARIAVEQWIVGPDTDPIVDVRLGSEVSPSAFLEGRSPQGDKRVIVYLGLSRGKWWLMGERTYEPDRPAVGLEVLSSGAALRRIPAIRKSVEASSPESLAVRADLAVVGTLERYTDNRLGILCHVERVVSGTPSSSELTVVTQTPGDLRLGKALLLLKRRPDSTWEPLNDGAGCYFLDEDRFAHLTVPTETLLTRVAAAHARRVGGAQR